MVRTTKALSAVIVAILLAGGAGAVGLSAPARQEQTVEAAAAGYNPSREECQVLALINRYRASRNEPKLVLSKPLGAVAEDHSGDMARQREMYHTSNLLTTVRRAGYDGQAVGENVAAGYASAKAVVNGWSKSAGHRQNMLNGRFRAIGIGEQNGYWTTTFGDKADQTVRC